MQSRPEISIPAALATAALVYAIYNRGMPSTLDLRQGEPGEPNAASVRKGNAWMAAGAVGAVSLIARDPNIFIVGGAAVIALDWSTRHAIWTDPFTGRLGAAGDEPYAETAVQAVGDDAYGPDLAAVG